MYLDDDSRRPSLTPQLALRVAIIGGIALVAFARRLLPPLVPAGALGRQVRDRGQRQPGARDQGAGAARRDRGPRGPGAGGQPHRPGREGHARQAARGPTASGARSTAASAACSGMQRRADRARGGRASSRRCRSRRPRSSRTSPQKLVSYLLENQEDFPGVTVEQVFLREYPHQQVGAHLFGTVGEITKEQLEDTALPRRGPGRPRRPVGHRVPVRPLPARARTAPAGCRWTRWATCAASCATVRPEQGRQLRLSVDLDVQRVGQQALGGAKGAFVVMNVNNGEVLALGSSPSFDPNIFAKVIRQRDFKRLSSKENGEPLLNRAIQARLSHRLDLQADHRHRGAGGRADHARHRAVRRRLAHGRRRDVQERRRRGATARSRCARRCRCRATCSSTASARRPTARATGC